MLKTGIIGLPNVGKSTLFSALTKAKALAANYPFTTIEPNVGMVNVYDPRLTFLANLYHPEKIIPASVQFIDIAGLVKGASQGEGLGNQFLSHIREVHAIAQVVRCFEDENIIHVDGSVDPIRDIETIELELFLADLETVERRLGRLDKKVKANLKEAVFEAAILTKIKAVLDQEKSPRSLSFNDLERKTIKSFNLLSLKPMIYIANVAEADLLNLEENAAFVKLKKYAEQKGIEVIGISAQVEKELVSLDKEEQLALLSSYGMDQSGLNQVIQRSYELLGLETFFTTGEDEVRAWTFTKGMKASECAGIIHSDFERGFIRAETVSYTDLFKYKTPQLAKEAGKIRLEGKEYLVQDGDIILFRFNV